MTPSDEKDSVASRRRSLAGVALTAFFLILAFPPFNQGWLAWASLLPLLRTLTGRNARSAFRLGALTGLVFFSGTLYWFVFMAFSAGIPLFLSVLAAVSVVVYLSCYFGVFAAAVVVLQAQSLLWRMLLVPAVWVALEFVRDRFMSGFGWLFLGHTQWTFLPVIQIADVTGVFGISFVVVMVNVFLFDAWRYGRWSWDMDARVLDSSRVAFQMEREATLRRGLIMTLVVCGGVLIYGAVQLWRPAPPAATAVFSVVQGNTDQRQKMMPPTWPDTLRHYLKLTREAAGAARTPDLVIWPENSFPGYVWMATEMFVQLQNEIGRLGVPHLIGAVTQDNDVYHNTAFLFDNDGDVAKEYHKIHLVPFGEYVPLRRQFPALADLVPVLDFARGEDWSPLELPGRGAAASASAGRFAVLICFEDTVARVARRFVGEGAQLLVNITNDGWFGDTPAPYLHLQAAVFRSVENRRELVRAANTGISAFIDRYGRVTGILEGNDGRPVYAAGVRSQEVRFYDEETFYTKYGDVFTYGIFGCILFWIITLRKRPRPFFRR